MSIEFTEFSDVSISVSPSGIQSGNFGILGMLTNEEGVVSVAERKKAYKSLAGVGEDWDTSTEVYKAAQAFYAATPSPTDFVVLMCFETAQAATITGGAFSDLTSLVGVTAGTLNISVDGETATVSDIDLSSAESFDDVATLVQTAITDSLSEKTCTVTFGTLGFKVVSGTTGATSTIDFATGDVAEMLGITQELGALSEGLDPETPVQALTTCISMGIKFTGLVTHKKYRDIVSGGEGGKTMDIANWAEAAKKIFCNTSNNLAVLNSAITSDVISLAKANSLRFTLSTYSRFKSQYPSAAVFGRAAAVNFSGIDTTITLNLKQLPTITAEDLTPAELKILESKHGSAVVVLDSQANAYTNSMMASGSWLDTTHGLLWLENRCSVDMFNLLYQTTTKIPYTQSGINTTAATLATSLEAAVRNGLAAPGFLPDGTFLPNGYIVEAVPLKDVASSDKSNRIYKGLSFKMVGAGALHKVVVSGTFTE